ncbi:phasin [Stappia sp. WLB 29]|uniref:phasin n=1 Tax=Stappia sp. WLB 29 TaxID=2925220 RepID=UPI0020BFD611|nr:phasin [Stappia sp. WLB 29]
MTETKTAAAAPKAPRAKTAKAAEATVSAFPNFEAFTMPKMEIPAVTREMAEKSIEQAREAYAKLKTAAEDATDLLEDGFETTRRGVLDFNHKAVDAARTNTDATFQFVKDLFEVKTLAEAIELQTSFARAQFDAFGAQAKDMQELSTKLAGEMNETFKGAVEKASKDFKAA